MDLTQCYKYYMSLLENAGSVKYVHNVKDLSFAFPICTFTGHRPSKFPFRGESDPACLRLRSRIGEAVEKAYADGYRDFLCGMALGVDTWAAMEVLRLKYIHRDVNLYAAVPYLSQASRWYAWERERYTDILKLCERVFVVCEVPSRQAPVIRDAFMVSHSSRIIAVYDGSNTGGTATTYKMAQKKGIEIVRIDPKDVLPDISSPINEK